MKVRVAVPVIAACIAWGWQPGPARLRAAAPPAVAAPSATAPGSPVAPAAAPQVAPSPPTAPPEQVLGPVASVSPFRRVVPPAAGPAPIPTSTTGGTGGDGAGHAYCSDATGVAETIGLYEPLDSGDRCSTDSCTGDSCCTSRPCKGKKCHRCAPAFWEHRSGVFGQYLLLQPSGADVAYGQPRDGLVPLGSVPVGAVGVVSPEYRSGFAAGGNVRLSRCSSLVGTFTQFESRSSDAISTTTPNAIHSLLVYPGTVTAFSGSLNATATYDVDFRLADADYRHVWWANRCTVVNYLIGARYGQLNQDLLAQQVISPGTTSVLTDVEFEGGGARLGLDGEQRWRSTGFFWYGRGVSSFLSGRIRASYLQANTFSPVQATTSWQDDRVVPVLEYELGIGWQNPTGTLRLKAGYFMSAWYNMVTTSRYIQAVQASNYADVGDTMTFDGLVARVELRW